MNSSTDGIVDYEIGGAGVDSVFNGTIADGNTASRATAISKIGNNNLTLNGTFRNLHWVDDGQWPERWFWAMPNGDWEVSLCFREQCRLRCIECNGSQRRHRIYDSLRPGAAW